MTVGVGDVDNCFHRMRIDKELGSYFALGEMTAAEAGLTELDGVLLSPSDIVYPCCACLPMGFSWFLWFAQRTGEYQLARVPSLRCAGTYLRKDIASDVPTINKNHSITKSASVMLSQGE